MKKTYPIVAALSLAAITLSSCGKEATGQVAAVVNDEEITLQEINAELQGANIPEGVDEERAQQVALQRVIDRRLMAQAARDEGLDQTPEFLVRKRQLEEALLLQLLTQKIDQTNEVPDTSTIDQYIEDNPALFAGRTIYTVDRIQFPVLPDMSVLQELEDDMSMDEVIASLNDLGIEFERAQGEMDSAQVGQERLDIINALPDGEPFVVVENGMVFVADVIGSRPAPLAEDERQPLAVASLRRKTLSDAMKARLETAKATAEISYQDGFSPSSDDNETGEANEADATAEPDVG